MDNREPDRQPRIVSPAGFPGGWGSVSESGSCPEGLDHLDLSRDRRPAALAESLGHDRLQRGVFLDRDHVQLPRHLRCETTLVLTALGLYIAAHGAVAVMTFAPIIVNLRPRRRGLARRFILLPCRA